VATASRSLLEKPVRRLTFGALGRHDTVLTDRFEFATLARYHETKETVRR
jgi:hypothetical protein